MREGQRSQYIINIVNLVDYFFFRLYLKQSNKQEPIIDEVKFVRILRHRVHFFL